MIQNEFEQIYDKYTHMMLFASSNKLRLENMRQEIVEAEKAYSEILEIENKDLTLNSMKGLNSRLEQILEEIESILYQYRDIDDMLHHIDVMIADYYELDIEIDLYELNGIEKDLLDVRNENDNFNIIKSEINVLKQTIDDKINELKD